MQAVQVVLFGLLLSLSMLNESGSQSTSCKYYYTVPLDAGQTHFVYNPYYPDENKRDCTYIEWQITSRYNIEIKCSIEKIDCSSQRISVLFNNGNIYRYCSIDNSNYTFFLNGANPIIKYEQYTQGGRFLCQIQILEDKCKCGWQKVTRIVGGKETGVNEYPMMCGLVDADNKLIFCGCTIISAQYILTAAHCVGNRKIDKTAVVVGEHDTRTGKETKATKLFRLEKCILHPQYDSTKVAYNDVAICKIFDNITYSAEVGPVCLPFQHKEYSFENNYVTALGWGLLEFAGQKSDTLRGVNLNVITSKKCEDMYSKYSDTLVSNRNICTLTPKKDACQMDSGGPLLWQDPTTHNLVLAGITSGGAGCGSGDPAIGMRTGAFIDWIERETPGVQYCKLE